MFCFLLIHRALVEDVIREAMHEAAHDVENEKAGSEDNTENEEAILSKEDKFEEITDERDSEGGNHDADNSK